MSRARTAVAIAAGYVALSVVLGLIGWLRGERLIGDATPELYLVVQLILGPLAFALNLGGGVPAPDLTFLWVLFYLVATTLLALCLFQILRRSNAARILGIVMGVAIWLASGLLNVFGLLRGL